MSLPRWMHRVFARVCGFFWIPCPVCGRWFGGHEKVGGTLWTSADTMGPTSGRVLCQNCSGDRYSTDYPPAASRLVEVTEQGVVTLHGVHHADLWSAPKRLSR